MRKLIGRGAVIAAPFLLAACAHDAPAALEADARIEEYSERIADHPRVYATHLGLAQAYLDKARLTHDAQYVSQARAAAANSLAVMPSLEGYKMQARIAAFRHRFDEALEWAIQAQSLLTADVADGAVTALLVEAHMGLKDFDKARALLPQGGAALPDFHTAAAMGHFLKSQGKRDEAAAAFAAASHFAAVQNARALAAWGETMAAGVYLDLGEPQPARPHLAAAAVFDPNNRELRIHEAELMTLEGDIPAAIARYEALLDDAPDAELHRRLYNLTNGEGDDAAARAHYAAAEKLLIGVLAAGEGYVLDELVRLYEDAGMGRDVARRRAQNYLSS